VEDVDEDALPPPPLEEVDDADDDDCAFDAEELLEDPPELAVEDTDELVVAPPVPEVLSELPSVRTLLGTHAAVEDTTAANKKGESRIDDSLAPLKRRPAAVRHASRRKGRE